LDEGDKSDPRVGKIDLGRVVDRGEEIGTLSEGVVLAKPLFAISTMRRPIIVAITIARKCFMMSLVLFVNFDYWNRCCRIIAAHEK
jgi:hypothetical protein